MDDCWNRGRSIFKFMRLGSVIGRVTLSRSVPALAGARWLIVSPFTREHFQAGPNVPAGLSKEPSPVIYDDLGGGIGQTIGFIEGREAASPFEQPIPIESISAALLDEICNYPYKPRNRLSASKTWKKWSAREKTCWHCHLMLR